MKLFTLTMALASFALVLSAQDDAAFQTWMKSTNSEMGVLRKIESKTGPEAAASAEKLSAIYQQVSAYWSAKHADDAVKIADEGKSAADTLAVAAKAGESEKAAAAFKTLGGTCRGCHEAHREKAADGTYKIK